MASLNQCNFIGRLGADPRVATTESGRKCAQFSIACDRSYKAKDGSEVKSTEWINIVLWDGRAEVAEKFLKKGSLVFISGELRNRSYDAQDGTKRYVTEIFGYTLQLMPDGQRNAAPLPPEPDAPAAQPAANASRWQQPAQLSAAAPDGRAEIEAAKKMIDNAFFPQEEMQQGRIPGQEDDGLPF